MFRTRITKEALQGPNFAGHYTVATWGCGTGCTEFAIVNAKTGTVFFPSFGGVESIRVPCNKDDIPAATEPNAEFRRDNVVVEDVLITQDIAFRRDSRLLIVTGIVDETERYRHFYEWTGRQLRVLLSVDFYERTGRPLRVLLSVDLRKQFGCR